MGSLHLGFVCFLSTHRFFEEGAFIHSGSPEKLPGPEDNASFTTESRQEI